jgi:hypothetical protein
MFFGSVRTSPVKHRLVTHRLVTLTHTHTHTHPNDAQPLKLSVPGIKPKTKPQPPTYNALHTHVFVAQLLTPLIAMLSRPFILTCVSLEYVPHRLGIVLWKCLGVRPEDILKKTLGYCVGNNVVFSNPFLSQNGTWKVNIFNKRGQPSKIATPKMRLPRGPK